MRGYGTLWKVLRQILHGIASAPSDGITRIPAVLPVRREVAVTAAPGEGTGALVILRGGAALRMFCGRSLLGRHLETLRMAGVGPAAVMAADPSLPGEAGLGGIDSVISDSDGLRSWIARRKLEKVIIVEGDLLLDPRLFREALGSPEPAAFVTGEDKGGSRVPAGVALLAASDLSLIPASTPVVTAIDGLISSDRLAAVDLSLLPSYNGELRKDIPLYSLPVESEEQRARARTILVRASGKGHQDLPAIVFNRPLEEMAARRLCETAVTPNQITSATNIVAWAVTGLFAAGQLWIGVIGALAVGVLDGLDGRQARLQVRYSPFGRLEHLFDKLYEISWTLALGWHFSRNLNDPGYLRLSALWLLFYLLDSGAYDLFRARRGFQLDEASPVDRAFRLIGGRRNIYVFMLIGGLLAGSPQFAFRAIVGWAGVTAAIHWVRAALLLLRGDGKPGAGENRDG